MSGKTVILSLVFIFLAASGFCQMGASDQPNGEPNVPEGMELIKVGATNILVPKGSKMYRKDALLILEPPEQYWTRRIVAVEEEIARLRSEEEQMQAEIDDLKQALNQTENAPKK